MQNKFANAMLTILAVCALVVTGLVVKQEFARAPNAVEDSPAGINLVPRVSDSLWRKVSTTGNLRGDSSAPVVVVVFSDYECPACRAFAATLTSLRQKYPKRLAVRIHNYPLETIHPFARSAALAAECAAAAGRFAAYDSLLFERVPSFVNAPWIPLAVDAGVRDTTRFRACLQSEAPALVVSADTSLGDEIPVRGTPTVLVNRFAFDEPPSETTLEAIIDTTK